jgi:uncharacterized protein YjbI with pentapeptide repeats
MAYPEHLAQLADLTGANLTGTSLGSTVPGGTDLTGAKGLETLIIGGPA